MRRVKFFAYTHQAEILADASDEDAVRAALSEQTKFWGNSRLKVLRVAAEDIIAPENVDVTGHTPCPTGQQYFNYVEANLLDLPEATNNLMWSHDPSPTPQALA